MVRRAATWRNATYVIFGLAGFGLASWVSRIPAVRDSLNASNVQMGVLALAIAVGSISGLIGAGRIAGRFSARRVISTSLTAASIGLLLAAIGTATSVASYGMVFAGLLIFGAGTGVCNVTMNAEGTLIERAIRAPIMPLFHAAFSIGAVAGATLGVLATLANATVVIHLTVVAVIVIASAVISVRSLQSEGEMPATATKDAAAPSIEIALAEIALAGNGIATLVDPASVDATPACPRSETSSRANSPWLELRTVLIGIVVLGTSFANGSANDWIALAMVDGHGGDNGTGALAFDVFVVAVVAGRLAGMHLLARFGRVRILQASALFTAGGILIFIFALNPAVAIVLGVIPWGLGTALGFPVGMSAAADEPSRTAARISVIATIGYTGSLAGPPIIGFLAGRVGLLNALLVVLVLVVAAGILAPAASKKVFTPRV